MSIFKLFSENPLIFTLAIVLQLVVSLIAMKIGFEVILLVLKVLTWLVPKLDTFGRWAAFFLR